MTMTIAARVVAVVAAAGVSIAAIIGVRLPENAEATIAALLILLVGFFVPSIRGIGGTKE
jgi:Flp pilus assembly protein protease CpaA